ncbi:MAG TPA: RagB/SusD family nutrient uptake outer membrane protein [Prolixibacteraceae bacterium]|nr:RagB/SusD family nutrient uptake outer membrane protein [Marinilabiliales bacterium]HBL74629.1 RagB/SusD family nutrient uptake outer membrane protein [Prolixibacteraceae bacterium]HCU60864.1 RagB/SusD family nutrient uptake outer membrane protein [Prolixibacteraceae bacterium]
MKKLYISNNLAIYKLSICFLIAWFTFSCNEKEFLKEVPLDFYSPENSFVTAEDFEAAIYSLHASTRNGFWGQSGGSAFPRIGWLGTDLVESRYDASGSQDYSILWGPTGTTLGIWELCYQIIYDANVIVGRSESDDSKLTDEQKILVQAEARFFRAYAYNVLASLYGGVPIILEEVTTPKRDYVRATRQAVYEQCAEDLKFAVANLPNIDAVDESRINKLAASHVLSEVYISLGKYQDAINEATKVIDHPKMALMNKRFGANNEKEFNDPNWEGDIYWDLFRQGNQDRSAGNTESIWVLQYSYKMSGGGDSNYELERIAGPDFTAAHIYQSNGKTVPILKKPNTYYCGRGQGFCKPSPYFLKTLWEKSGYTQDMRNSRYNIIRDIKVNNPSNQYNGKWVIADKLPLKRATNDDTTRVFYPIIGKIITPGKHPAEFWDPDQTIPGSLLGTAAHTWRKHYMIRLAETYLLRAEAYLGIGDKVKAAADINVVRRRAKATDVTSDKVDIDYILDEQLRELGFETLRIITLGRLGKVVDRVKRLNPVAGKTIQSHQNLWAIPYSEISKNVEAVLEQNPGY